MVCLAVGRETAREVNLHIETFPWPDMKQSIPQHTFLLRDLTLKYHQDVWVAIGSYGYCSHIFTINPMEEHF